MQASSEQTNHTNAGLNTGGHAEIKHESTIYAEPIFHIGSFPVTNSLFNSWIAVALIVIFAVILKSKIRLIPKGIQNVFEAVIDMLLNLFDSITGSHEKSVKYFPFVFSLFVFILVTNWISLFPGAGAIGQVVSEHGEKVFIPYLRGGTADLNATLSLAIIGVVASHVMSVITIGAWKYINKFVNIQALIEIPRKVMKDPSVLFINPIKVLVGLLEIISEIAKIASLSFRLFGNIFAGEVLLASISATLAFGLPLPFMFLEVMVGAIQALIFSVLVLAYLSMMTTAEEH